MIDETYKLQILQKIITGLDNQYEHDIAELDMQGDLYEYMLGKMSAAEQNGQFRTPKHIREMMVELIAPTPDDLICDIAVTRLIHRAIYYNMALLRSIFMFLREQFRVGEIEFQQLFHVFELRLYIFNLLVDTR